jgi:hypothetical protein
MSSSSSTPPPIDYTANTIAPSSIFNINASVCQDVANAIWRPKNDAENYNYFPAFENTVSIRMAHTGVPRGGRSNDMLDVVIGSREEAEDYLAGLLVSAIIILSFFGGWIVLLILLKCMGRNRVGWLSGRRKKLPPKPTKNNNNNNIDDNDENDENENGDDNGVQAAKQEVVQEVAPLQPTKDEYEGGNPQDDNDDDDDDDNVNKYLTNETASPEEQETDKQEQEDNEEADEAAAIQSISSLSTPHPQDADTKASEAPPRTMEEWNQLYQSKMTQQRWLKGVTITACLVVIAMAVIMATKGVQSLQGSLTEGKNSINYAQTLLDAADETLGGLIFFLDSFQKDMQFLLEGTNQICPNIRPLLCNNLNDVETCNTTGVFGDTPAGQDLSETFERLVQVFYQDWNIVTRLEDLRRDLQDIAATTEKAENQISTFDWVFYVAVFFDVLVGLLATWMIVYLVIRHKLPWCVKCMHHRLLFPVFIVFVLFSFIFAIAFLVTSLVMSDT